MKKLTFLLSLSMAAIASSPGAAQPNEPIQQRFLACLAEREPQNVRNLLSSSDPAVARRAYARLQYNSRCFDQSVGSNQFTAGELTFSMDVLRGRLAEQALLSAQTQAAALPALPLQQKRYIRPWFASTGRNPAVDEMGACMADTDPAGILALVRTAPGSAGEGAAIAALSPSMIRCLSARTQLHADRTALRAALADALYQRLNNPALSMAEVKK